MDTIREFQKCLSQYFGLEPSDVQLCIEKIEKYITEKKVIQALEDFVKKARLLAKTTIKIPLPLNPDDATLKAGQWHEILTENEFVRVLFVSSLPGEYEPSHTHQWRSILLVFQPGMFEVYHENTFIGQDKTEIGTYEIPPEPRCLAYKNIGASQFSALRLELKK
jgi:hypothetical protein